MAVQVLVGANAQSDASQFLSGVTEFQNAVNKLISQGQKLSSGGDWQGNSAKKFQADFQQFQSHVKQMEQSLHTMATGAKSIIDQIDQTDAQGVGKIGNFAG
jgi:WXG100 family type VII secretion target